jgi:hypothetical protein
MKLILSLSERKLTIQRTAFIKLFSCLALIGVVACSAHQQQAAKFQDYSSFVQLYSRHAPVVAEIYGQYAAEHQHKRVRSNFNLLLEPGKRAYIEILDPSDRLIHALSLSRDRVSLFWPADHTYIDEEANPQTLNAILGLPVHPDDALELIAGRGLYFPKWQESKALKDGWDLTRGQFFGKITAKKNLSKIKTVTPGGTFETFYDHYQLVDNQSRPTRIRFEVPDRELSLELRIDKYVPRPEEPSADLFDLKLPHNSRKLSLNQIYEGKPLLLE